MKCESCGEPLSTEAATSRGGKILCEDCLMDAMNPPRACDPWAVKMATSGIQTKAEAESSLRGVERRLYDLVCKEGRAIKTDASERLGIRPSELERAFSVLRHMELLRASKLPDGTVALVPFTSEN